MSHTAGTPGRVNSLRKAKDDGAGEGRARSPVRDSTGHGRHSSVSQASVKHQDDLRKLEDCPKELELSTEPDDVALLKVEERKHDFEKITNALVGKIQGYVRSLHSKTVPLGNIESLKFDAEVKELMQKLDDKNTELLKICNKRIPDKILPTVKDWQGDSKDTFVKAWNKGIADLATVWKGVPTGVANLEKETESLLDKVKKA